ncbi:MAG: hypothetical protein R3194_04525 [Limnobacter sp.]|nr:hypothetical protein [Limnobacter sp.]
MNTTLKASVCMACLPLLFGLAGCGGSDGAAQGSNVNAFAQEDNPSQADLQSLLDQGLVNADAIDLDDGSNRETNDTQDAFDL